MTFCPLGYANSQEWTAVLSHPLRRHSKQKIEQKHVYCWQNNSKMLVLEKKRPARER